MEVTTIKEVIEKFIDPKCNKQHSRETTFDLCYNYFQMNRRRLAEDMEKSCCVLWSYLASWGMLRGSTLLIQKNPAFLIDLVKYIASDDCDKIFEIDVDDYKEGGIEEIMRVYEKIEAILSNNEEGRKPTATLITKIMLGIFGCVPAYDQYFCNTFKELMPGRKFDSTRLNPESLIALLEFYNSNQKEIKDLAKDTHTIDIFSEADDKHTSITYTKAKIIDMYGFNVGLAKAQAEAAKRKAEKAAAKK